MLQRRAGCCAPAVLALTTTRVHTFQATIRLFYPDPLHAKVGEAGAEQDPTVGLRDVTFRY